MDSENTALNVLEIELLKQAAQAVPIINAHLPFLRVLNREKTGVGMYINFTYFQPPNEMPLIVPATRTLHSNFIVQMPPLKFGLSHEFVVEDGKIILLELVANGEEWNGDISDFVLIELTNWVRYPSPSKADSLF